jgi:hypothetical protein
VCSGTMTPFAVLVLKLAGGLRKASCLPSSIIEKVHRIMTDHEIMVAACCHHDMLDQLKRIMHLSNWGLQDLQSAGPRLMCKECTLQCHRTARRVHRKTVDPRRLCIWSLACTLACEPTEPRTSLRISHNDPQSSFEHACMDTGVVSSSHTQQKQTGCTRVRTWAPLGNRCQVRLPSDFKSVVLDHSTIQPKMTNRQFCMI